MWIAIGCLGLVELVNRVSLISKTVSLTKLSDDPMWKVWRLSAVEPVITTSIGLVTLLWISLSYVGRDDTFHIVTLMCILPFMVWIWVIGRRYQRGRLTLLALFLRFIIISVPFIFGIDLSWNFLVGSLLIPFAFRVCFGVYQNSVTPTRDEFLRQQTEDEIYLGRREIEDGITLTDDVDLWDEQVALIERLKAEEVTAAPSPNSQMVNSDVRPD